MESQDLHLISIAGGVPEAFERIIQVQNGLDVMLVTASLLFVEPLAEECDQSQLGGRMTASTKTSTAVI